MREGGGTPSLWALLGVWDLAPPNVRSVWWGLGLSSVCASLARAVTATPVGDMAEGGPGGEAPARRPVVVKTAEFRAWSRSLDPERRAKVGGAITRIVDGGPTLGRPHVDVIHGSRVRKLKESRIDRSTRVLFAFDSNQNAVMLLGGDKAGKWNRWYPNKIKLAERLYADHERSIGKEPRCLTQRVAARMSPERGR
jgi:hypothetical protein